MKSTGYKSPLRPIPRHTIPPEFPLSLAHGSEMAESFLTQQGRGSHSHPSQLFSCLAIASQEPENNGNVLYNGSECDDYDDEEGWWEEVFNHLENLKKKTNSSIIEEEVSLVVVASISSLFSFFDGVSFVHVSLSEFSESFFEYKYKFELLGSVPLGLTLNLAPIKKQEELCALLETNLHLINIQAK